LLIASSNERGSYSGLAKKPRKWRSPVSNTPKDSPDNPTPEIKPIQAPAGLDLHPTPRVIEVNEVKPNET
jgi:hypothetical protein